ncbi:hypothetical protein AB0I37_27725 [Micromonospora purpureochromogenes]|uniref:hypothetical protein n=1 Tax=Micromonospora purpureochromogenes TaxID=47872 RepID=UPI0033C2ABBD
MQFLTPIVFRAIRVLGKRDLGRGGWLVEALRVPPLNAAIFEQPGGDEAAAALVHCAALRLDRSYGLCRGQPELVRRADGSAAGLGRGRRDRGVVPVLIRHANGPLCNPPWQPWLRQADVLKP